MTTDKLKASTSYKHSLMSYVLLLGNTDELMKIHCKLLDVIDLVLNGEATVQEAEREYAFLALFLARKLAGNVLNLMVGNGEMKVLRSSLALVLYQVDEASELSDLQKHAMIMRSINSSLVRLGELTGIDYPDLEKLK